MFRYGNTKPPSSGGFFMRMKNYFHLCRREIESKFFDFILKILTSKKVMKCKTNFFRNFFINFRLFRSIPERRYNRGHRLRHNGNRLKIASYFRTKENMRTIGNIGRLLSAFRDEFYYCRAVGNRSESS